MNKLVLAMNTALATAAKASGAIFIDADPFFTGHRLCNPDPYIQWKLIDLPGFGDGDDDGISDPMLDLFNRGVFHPSQQGHQAYLKAIESGTGC